MDTLTDKTVIRGHIPKVMMHKTVQKHMTLHGSSISPITRKQQQGWGRLGERTTEILKQQMKLVIGKTTLAQ